MKVSSSLRNSPIAMNKKRPFSIYVDEERERVQLCTTPKSKLFSPTSTLCNNNNTYHNNIGGFNSEERVAAIIEDLDMEIEAKCNDIKCRSEHFALVLRRELAIQLAKLPQKVRGMSLKQFQQDYNEDVKSVMEAEMARTMNDIHKLFEKVCISSGPKTSSVLRPKPLFSPLNTPTQKTKKMRP